MRIKWNSSFPNPAEILRNKYYEFIIDNSLVLVSTDGTIIGYTISQAKELFILESGSWEDVLKTTKKENK